MECKTIKVQYGDSFMVINASDFDKKKHKIFKDLKGEEVKEFDDDSKATETESEPLTKKERAKLKSDKD